MAKKLLFLTFIFVYNTANSQCFTSVNAYNRNVITRASDGSLWFRGINNSGQRGDGNTTTPSATFVQIGTDTNWTDSYFVGSSRVWALKTNGTIWYWGTIASNVIITPTQFDSDTDWKEFSTNSQTHYAIKENGTLWAWGSNMSGRLGTGNLDDQYTTNIPIQVGTASNWEKVVSNVTCTLALKTDGTIWSWGDSTGDYLGYVGGNLNNNYRSPKQIGTATDWDAISVNSDTKSFGFKANGVLWSWGGNTFQSQIFSYSLLPVQFGTESWKMASANIHQLYLIKSDGTRWGEGRNYWPQYMGTGTGTGGGDLNEITQLDTDSDWKYVHGNQNEQNGFAIKENGSLYFWGFGWFAGEGPFESPTLIASPCTLSTDTFEKQPTVTLAPNPADDFVTLTFSDLAHRWTTYTIVNSLGQLIQAETAITTPTSSLTIDTSTYANGVYYLSLKQKDQTKTLRFIK